MSFCLNKESKNLSLINIPQCSDSTNKCILSFDYISLDCSPQTQEYFLVEEGAYFHFFTNTTSDAKIEFSYNNGTPKCSLDVYIHQDRILVHFDSYSLEGEDKP
jgi:hypothetical protein